jgi:hypothetical protein
LWDSLTVLESISSSPDTKAALGESSPDFTSVGTTIVDLIGLNNSITGLNKVGIAWLEFHSVNEELQL